MMATVRGSRIERLAIMQDFLNNEKKTNNNGCQSAILDFITAKWYKLT